MSWNRTVTCSHCYDTGHNRTGCPKLKAFIEANPNSYAASKERAKKLRVRKCGYCAQPKHNRTTCQEFSRRRMIAAHRNKRFRSALLEHFKNLGIGVGALVNVPTETGWLRADAPKQKLGYISTIQWENFNIWNFKNAYYGMRSINCTYFVSSGTARRLTVPACPNKFNEPVVCAEYAHGCVSDGKGRFGVDWILGPLLPEDVERGVPANWLDGTDSALDIHFCSDSTTHTHDWVLT